MNCNSCGHENRDGATFCDRCGARLAVACASCRTQLRTGARFCDACGTPVGQAAPDVRALTPPHLAERILRDRAALEGERRTVTVLFIDGVGSVNAGGRVDPEELHRMVHACTERMIEAVHHYEGTVTQFRGDGIMAIFGAPIAHEDGARRAVAAALEMRDRLAAHRREIDAAGGHAYGYRIGLNTGPVIVGRIGDDLSMDYTAIGGTVDLAARMEQWAAPGTVYVTESTQRATADYFEFRDLGPLEVRGKPEPVPAFEVVRGLPVRTRLEAAAARGLTPYVGRRQERGVLAGYFEEARQGRGQVVFVSGEAGIGKSRLLLEFHQSLGDGARWLEGHCISYGRNMPWVPIVDFLRRAFGIAEGDDETGITAKLDAAVARWSPSSRGCAPYLKFLLNVDPGDVAVAEMDPALRRAGVLDALRTLLGEEGTQAPVVLVIEDLHWIDANSEEAIAALVDVVATSPVLMILTYRPGYAHALGDRSYYNRLALRHLPADESAELAGRVLGGMRLPAAVRDLIIARSEGNPFFMEEVAKSLVESGVVRMTDDGFALTRPIADVAIPDTIQGVILGRIDRLEQEAKAAIQLASVIGREFTVRLLQRVSDVDARLEGVLAELKSLELIYEKAYLPELSYMFKHALTHEVAISTLLATRRKALHRVVAAAVEELYADRLAEQYEVLAHHCFEGEDWPRALEYLVLAADKSAAVYANADAIKYYDRALDVCERTGEWERVYEVGMKPVYIDLVTGMFGHATATAARICTAMRKTGDRRREGRALVYQGYATWWDHQFEEAEATLRQAIAIGDEGFPDIAWSAQFALWVVLVAIGRLDDAAQYESVVREVPDYVDDEYDRTWWTLMQSSVIYWRGDLEAARIWIDEHAPQLRPREVDVPTWIGAQAERGMVAMTAGEYERALAIYREVYDACVQIGEMPYRGRVLNCIGWIYGELQDHERAIAYDLRSIDAAIEMNAPDPEIENNARLNIADSMIAMGRLDEAEEQLRAVERAIRDPRPEDHWALWIYSGHHLHTHGELWLRRGDTGRALAYAEECIEQGEWAKRAKNVAKGRRLRGQALVARGDLAGAEPELEQALEIARRVTNPRQIWESQVALGDLRRAQGREDEALALFNEALALAARVAEGLSDEHLRGTFVSSPAVQAIRDRCTATSRSS